ncbi:MAG: hypothetical protein LUG21_04550 [Clostridiales bacterium]|nr:hypothetical protein [Clostridiales bacterium]
MIYKDALHCKKVASKNGHESYKIIFNPDLVNPKLVVPAEKMCEKDMMIYALAHMLSVDSQVQENLEKMAKRCTVVRDILNSRDEITINQIKARRRQ